MNTSISNFIKGLLASLVLITFSACENDNDSFKAEAEARIHNEPSNWHLNPDSTNERLAEAVVSQRFQYGPLNHHKVEFFTAPSEFGGDRPLVILAPGGGWSSYTEMPKLRQLASNLALKGLNAAIVKYATGNPGYNTYVKAFQDLRSSVRFFRLNAEAYAVDTANIFIGGWSTGAATAFSVAYLDSSEIATIGVGAHRMMITNAVNQLGFDNSDNPGASSKVRGYIGMFTYSFDNNMIDRSDAAMMLINHWDAHFNDGTRIIGTYYTGTVPGYGTDPIALAARNKGFVDGQDLEYIRISGASQYKGSNQASLHHEYWDDIARFVKRNAQ